MHANTDETLVFSFIGYKSQNVKINKQKAINVVLETSDLNVNEVVIVGYGTVKKSDLTGSVTSVKTEKLMASAPSNIQQALQGKAAGVLISSGNGVNSTPNIRIRGNRSIGANNDPLLLLMDFL